MSLKGVGLQSSLGLVISLVDRVLREITAALQFQMRSLEPISAIRHSRRGPDSSLIRGYIFVCTCCILKDSHSVGRWFLSCGIKLCVV